MKGTYAWECEYHQLSLTELLLGAQGPCNRHWGPEHSFGAGWLDAKPASPLKRGSLTLCVYFLICKQGLITVYSSLSCGKDEISWHLCGSENNSCLGSPCKYCVCLLLLTQPSMQQIQQEWDSHSPHTQKVYHPGGRHQTHHYHCVCLQGRVRKINR